MDLISQMNQRLVELLSMEIDEVIATLRSKVDSTNRVAARIEKMIGNASLRSPQEALRLVYQVKETQQKIVCNRIVGQQSEGAVHFYLEMVARISTYDGSLDDHARAASELLGSLLSAEKTTRGKVEEWIEGKVETSFSRRAG